MTVGDGTSQGPQQVAVRWSETAFSGYFQTADNGAQPITWSFTPWSKPAPSVSIAATDPSNNDATPAEAWETPLSSSQDDKLTFTVTRSGSQANGDFDSPLTVQLQPAAGTATPGDDYSGYPSSVTIPAGQASKMFTLTASEDNTTEGDETVALCLKASSDYRLSSYTATGTIHDVSVDLAVDSNNDGHVDTAAGGSDDKIEDDAGKPGQLIAVNDDDSDNDGIVDWADGYLLHSPNPATANTANETFTPIQLSVPQGVDASTLTFNFAYNASDPSAVNGSGTANDPYVLPSTGVLRLWTKVANRGEASVANGGSWIKPGEAVTGAQLGFTASTQVLTIYAEAVKPSTKQGDMTIGVTLDLPNSGPELKDEIRLTSLRTRESWQAQALKNANLDLSTWVPANGFPANATNVTKVYAYYTQLFNGNPNQFLWAGLAKLAGGAVYKGLIQERDMIDTSNHMLQISNEAGEGDPGDLAFLAIAIPQEQTFLQMQKSIFEDLAWQHEAYKNIGLFALTLLPTLEKTLQSSDIATQAWTDIDSGFTGQIAAGNQELLHREQNQILQPIYAAMPTIPSYIVGWFTPAFVPGTQSFTTAEGVSADIADYPTRWAWITTNGLPAWDNATPATRNQWVNSPLGSLIP